MSEFDAEAWEVQQLAKTMGMDGDSAIIESIRKVVFSPNQQENH